jgi:uncharacterized membrane protein
MSFIYLSSLDTYVDKNHIIAVIFFPNKVILHLSSGKEFHITDEKDRTFIEDWADGKMI